MLPDGSVKDFEFGVDEIELWNVLIERALKRGSYWVWFITEEHMFAPDSVEKLLSRDEAIVASVVLSRKPPFFPEAMKTPERRFGLNEIAGPSIMHEVSSLTSPIGVLVRRAVFEAIDPPWIDHADGMQGFTERAVERGYQPFIDTSVRIGNRLVASVYPTYRGGKWELVSSVGEAEFSLPLRHP